MISDEQQPGARASARSRGFYGAPYGGQFHREAPADDDDGTDPSEFDAGRSDWHADVSVRNVVARMQNKGTDVGWTSTKLHPRVLPIPCGFGYRTHHPGSPSFSNNGDFVITMMGLGCVPEVRQRG